MQDTGYINANTISDSNISGDYAQDHLSYEWEVSSIRGKGQISMTETKNGISKMVKEQKIPCDLGCGLG